MRAEMESLKRTSLNSNSNSISNEVLLSDSNCLRDISGQKNKENNAPKMKSEDYESPFSQPKVSFGTTMPSASKSALKKKLNFKQKQILNLEKIN